MVTTSYEARRRGITKLMGIAEARQKCPDLLLVSGEDLGPYRAASRAILDVLRRFGVSAEQPGGHKLGQMLSWPASRLPYEHASGLYLPLDTCGCPARAAGWLSKGPGSWSQAAELMLQEHLSTTPVHKASWLLQGG